MFRYIVLFCTFSVIKLDKCCSNQNRDNLNCKNLQLQDIPNCESQIHIKKFLLSSNKIKNLKKYSFSNYSYLTELRLDQNKMKVIQVDAFKGLLNLQLLYLQHNLLDYLEPTLLSELKSLKTINLNNNKFIKIPDISNSALNNLILGNNQIGSFYFPPSYLNCTNLRKIDLKNNLAKNPDMNHFYNLRESQIESLSMQSNRIDEISNEIFYFVRKRLRSFYINNNPSISDNGFQKILDSFDHVRHIESWHLDIFASNIGLKKLTNTTFSSLQHVSTQKLDLSDNSIEILPTDFNEVQSLLELHLDNNKLKNITNNQFKKMKKLRILILSHNLINFIDNYGFAGLKNLKKLDLSYNKITVLNLLTLNPLTSLKKLIIFGNKLIVLTSCLNGGISYLASSDWSTNKISQLNNYTNNSLCFSAVKCDIISNHKINFEFQLDIELNICWVNYNVTIENTSGRNVDLHSKVSFLKHQSENEKTVLIIIITVVSVIIIGLAIIFVIWKKMFPVKTPRNKKCIKTENFYESIDTNEYPEKV